VAYATVDELAAALRVRVTPDNSPLLQDCLDAAADEIDGFLDRSDIAVWPAPVPPQIARCNVNRAVEWFKASDAFNGSVGQTETGVLKEPPGDGFARHGLSIRRWKQQWGIA
jgi:hypothetical protein